MSHGAASAAAGRSNLRAYLAGAGATIALIAAAIVAFLAVATLVAFNGIPFGLGGDSGQVPIAEPATGPPPADAAAVVLLSGAGVADGGTANQAGATERGQAGAGSGGSSPDGGSGGAGDPAPSGSAPTGGAHQTASGGGSTSPSTGSDSGVVGGTVGTIEESAGNLGVDLPLGETTEDVTKPIDGTVNDALNDIGRVVGEPNLGDDVASGTEDVTGNLLP